MRDVATNGRFSFEYRTWFSASNVDIHTSRPHPPDTCVMCSTAAGFMPPTVRFRSTPPNTSMPGTSLRTMSASPPVGS